METARRWAAKRFSMSRNVLLPAAVASLALAGAAHAQSGMGPPDLDTDHDGKVTFTEFKAGAGARMMNRLDANKDGRITKAEFQVMVDRMAQMAGPEAQARAAERFAADDANHDGALSRSEVEAASRRRFDRADTNHDGWLSKGELLMMRQNRRGGPGG